MTTTRKHWAIFWLAWAVWLIASVAVSRAADVQLEWVPGDPTGTEYRIYEKTATGNVRVGTTTALTFTVLGVAPGVHTYVVTAANAFEESGPSNEAMITVPAPLAPPKNLRRKVVQQPQIFPKQQ